MRDEGRRQEAGDREDDWTTKGGAGGTCTTSARSYGAGNFEPDGLTYGGNLELTLTGSQAYALNTTFNLFKNFVTRSGSFSSVSLAAGGTPYDGLVFVNVGGGTWETGAMGGPLHEYLRFEQSTGNLVVVPEPSTYAMALAGLACGGRQLWRRRRLRQAASLAA